MKSIVARRAVRGAAFMDAVRPGWFDEIRLDDLDISSGKDCIMGQIYGDYWTGLKKIGIHGILVIPIRYGFDLGLMGIFLPWRLTRAWLREIEQRRVLDFCTHALSSDEEVAMASA